MNGGSKEGDVQNPKDAPRALVWFGRAGFVAKGIVFIVIGILAFLIALGKRSKQEEAGKDEALNTLSDNWYGNFLLIFVGVGLIGYGIWVWIEAIFDPANLGSDSKGILKRAAKAFKGVVYFLLALQALSISVIGEKVTGNNGESSSGSSSGSWTGKLMQRPGGRWVLGLIGAGVVIYGVYNWVRAYTINFDKKLDMSAMSSSTRTWVVRIGRLGYAAIGVTYFLSGVFIIHAARQDEEQQKVGLSHSLTKIAEQPYGKWLLGVVAVGLMCYGLFTMLLGKYRPVFTKNVDRHNHRIANDNSGGLMQGGDNV